jgi:hypothetical protein
MKVLVILMLSLVGCKEKYIDNDEQLPPLDKEVQEMFEAINKPLVREYQPKQYDQ